jgi:hypothetical protein
MCRKPIGVIGAISAPAVVSPTGKVQAHQPGAIFAARAWLVLGIDGMETQ